MQLGLISIPQFYSTSVQRPGCPPFSPGENIIIKTVEWNPPWGSTSTEKQNPRCRNTPNPKLILHYNMDRKKPTHDLQITWKTVRDGQAAYITCSTQFQELSCFSHLHFQSHIGI